MKKGLEYSQEIENWEDAIPLGNGNLGGLLWGSPSELKLSLDKSDLWDLEPMPFLSNDNYRFSYFQDCVEKGDIHPICEMVEKPYHLPATTKLPCGRIQLSVGKENVAFRLSLDFGTAVASFNTEDGVLGECFIHAERPFGVIRIQSDCDIEVQLLNPFTEGDYPEKEEDGQSFNNCQSLAFDLAEIIRSETQVGYCQPCGGQEEHTVLLEWKKQDGYWLAFWTVVTGDVGTTKKAQLILKEAFPIDYDTLKKEHVEWWKSYQSESSICVDNELLTWGWRANNYLFGAGGREGEVPISLQGVWTCDDGLLPPWKGDYHHNLNTQFCYYQAFSANHLKPLKGFLEWLWKVKDEGLKWTKLFYEHGGLNVPMIMTLDGKQMGGWAPYSHSPTTAGWLGHFFYLYWQYSKDKVFLKERAYPWLCLCSEFFENHSKLNESGVRILLLSSSAELHDNTLKAWFPNQITNYDLSIIRFVLKASKDIAVYLGLEDDTKRWGDLLNEFPQIHESDEHGLLISEEYSLPESHRHHAHLMPIFPFQQINSETEAGKSCIKASIRHLEELGTNEWCGYSWSWLASLYAVTGQGNEAEETLNTFLESFIAQNGFHLNGDQSGKGLTKFDYKPFTLEGNFTMALALQQMLLKSDKSVIQLFPAVPSSWKFARFTKLRTVGAFLISANMSNQQIQYVEIDSECGGTCRLLNPFNGEFQLQGANEEAISVDGDIISIDMKEGERVTLLKV